MERRADWSFMKLRSGRWIWRHTPDDPRAISHKSSNSFGTLSECIADAAVNGYDQKKSLAHIFGPLKMDEVLAVSKMTSR